MAQALKVRAGVWRVRWRYGGTRDGAQQSVTVKTSHRDALSLKRAVEERGHRVRRTDPDVLDMSIITGRPSRAATGATGVTFGEAADLYFETRTKLAPQSRFMQRGILDNHMGAWLTRGVDTITDDEVAIWVNGLSCEPRGPFSLASGVFRFAVRKGWITEAPTSGVELPDKPASPARFLTEAETDALYAVIGSERNRLAAWLALDGGLREAEICALSPADVQRQGDRDFIRIKGCVTRGKTTRWTIGPGKSKHARRTIVIPSDLADALRAFAASHGSAWLFPSGDTFLTPSGLYAAFSKAVRRAQKKGTLTGGVRFHDLRHTHASRLLNAGVPILLVSRRLGHASVAITADVYGHIDPATDAAVLGALAPSKASRRLRAV